MRLQVVITGEAGNLKAEIQSASGELDKLGRAGEGAGRGVGGGLGVIEAASRRLMPLLGAAGLAGAVMGVARAGDAMTASLGRLQAATGSIQAAADSYNQLYRLSLQTGVAVGDAANAFARFQISAREIGATRDQVLQLVRTLQQAGAVGGASAQETAAATQQLAQGLASGKLQGDELRSVLENMPTLAEALARELGVGIGELRKMGEEGKLTAEVVFPALLRAGERINREFQQLPVTMARGFAQLGVATTQFVADLDRAVGLSQRIAQAAQQAANALDRVRQGQFGTPQERATIAYDDARGRVVELERQAAAARVALEPGGPDRASPNLVGPARQAAQRNLASLERQLGEARQALERAAQQRGALEAGQPDERGAGVAGQETGLRNARRSAQTEYDGLRGIIDRPGQLRGEAAERRRTVERARDLGLISPEQATRDLGAIDRRLADDLKKLEERGPRDERDKRLREQLQLLDANARSEREVARATLEGGEAVREAEARQKALQEAIRLFPEGGARYDAALRQLTERHIELARAQTEGRAAAIEFQDAQENATLSLQRDLIGSSAVERARRTAELRRSQELVRNGIDPSSDRGRGLIAAAADRAERTLEVQRAEASFNELGRIGEQMFDRIGEAATRMALDGKNAFQNLKNLGNAVASELYQAFLRLALLNPLKNMVSGTNLPTLGDVAGRIAGWFGGGGSSSSFIDPTYGGLTYHTGGIAGVEGRMRAVPLGVFADAPRFHTGGFIGPDEVPAILQRGEGVFTAEQMRALGPAGGVSVGDMHFHFQGGDMGRPEDRQAMAEAVRAVVREEIGAAAPGIVRAATADTVAQANRGGSVARSLGRR
jgi:tape measure domain-containing protein